MNGRIYDPLIGRFLSADVLIQDSGNLQAYNRYSYVWNNPLTRTDPTGWWNIWNPLTYGLPSQSGENPWSPTDSSAEWHATAEGANGGAQIYTNSISMGASDALGVTRSSAFSGSEYAGSRYAGAVGSAALVVATGGAAAEGNAAARVLLAGATAKIAADSAVAIGEGSAKIAADPKSGEGYAQVASGVVGLAASAAGVRAGAIEGVSAETPQTRQTSEVNSSSASDAQGPPTANTRISNRPGNQQSVELNYPDGRKVDINPSRVKELRPATDPRAPEGTQQKTKFDNPQPGSKGYKRDPSPEERKIWDNRPPPN